MPNFEVPPTIFSWIPFFFFKQYIMIRNSISQAKFKNTETPQGCVLNSVLYNLFTSDLVGTHNNYTIVRFADDTSVIDLVTSGDETT